MERGCAWYVVGTVYIRTTKSRGIEYLQLAHNERDESGRVRAKILHNFGRKDSLDTEALKKVVRLIGDAL